MQAEGVEVLVLTLHICLSFCHSKPDLLAGRGVNLFRQRSSGADGNLKFMGLQLIREAGWCGEGELSFPTVSEAQ